MTDISSESVEELDESKEAESAKRVEAALFIAGRFLSIQDLVSLTDVNPILLKKILSDLQDKYKESGIEVVHKESKWKMDVAEDYRDIVNRLATGSSKTPWGINLNKTDAPNIGYVLSRT